MALDTALGACSAAVGTETACLAARFEERETGHAEALLPMVDAVLSEAKLRPDALNRIAVTVGPGSFTGTRIGLAAARAFGRALGVPVVGITTFEALWAATAQAGPVTVAFDARREQIYLQRFDRAGTALGEGRALGLAAAARELVGGGAHNEAVIGSAAAALGAACAAHGKAVTVLTSPLWPDARTFLALAAKRPALGEMPRPLYLRAPDVTVPGGGRP